MKAPSSISIIVPVLNEAPLIGEFLRHLGERAPHAEIVVADGGSNDGTVDLARTLADQVLATPRGRALQMNAGATAATGEVLWFLHADSLLPPTPLDDIRAALADPLLAGGCFRIRIPSSHAIYRVSDSLGNLGVDVFRIALGDHGIFCRRAAFEAVGGYPQVSVMEDAEFYRRLRRVGAVRQLRSVIQTSPRRYQRHGPYRTTLIYGLILALYTARVPIPFLSRLYRRLNGQPLYR